MAVVKWCCQVDSVVRPFFSSRSFTIIRCTPTEMPITRNRQPIDSQIPPNQSQKFWGVIMILVRVTAVSNLGFRVSS